MRARFIIAFAVCALGVASCGEKAEPQAMPSFASDGSPGASAGATGGPGQTPDAQPTAPGGSGGATAPVYPKNAKDYTLALLKAHSANNKTRVNQLAQQAAVLQLASYPGLDGNWNAFVSCQVENGTHTLCIWRNSHGDVGSVKLVNLQLGHPTAVVEALIDKTTFGTSADNYAQAFVSAWQEGNKERMKRLSNSTVVSFFSGKTPATGYTAHPSPDGQYTKVVMEGLPAGGFTFTLRITTASLGKANAIAQVS